MPLFPPAAPIRIVLDGRPLAAYVGAFLKGGRVYAPISPLFTRVADRVWSDGVDLIVERAGRRVRIKNAAAYDAGLDGVYVAAGPVLRALGAAVRYETKPQNLTVQFPMHSVVGFPTPFNPSVPSEAPRAVFTPIEAPTPGPLWTGSPLPRRTALPLPPFTLENAMPVPVRWVRIGHHRVRWKRLGVRTRR